ncbi:MAG: MFS transporter, partial [Verrucomicrobia bacterium]|nr:MFS transporter [Verrucomicrobiota bacterium]
GWKPLPSQIQVLNPIFTLTFIPIFNYAIYPAINRVFKLTPLRKIGLGLFLTATCFLIPAWLETQIAAGAKPGLGWQVLAFALITGAEVMVSITGLEFAYTQAPKRMKSLVMSFYLLSVSLGNLFTALVNHFIQNPDGTSKLAGAAYYNFFSVLMLVTAVIFVFVAIRYKEKTYIQDESPATA